MERVVTSLIELSVGIACLGFAIAAWRHRGALRIVSVVFTVAGIAAVVHAATELAQ